MQTVAQAKVRLFFLQGVFSCTDLSFDAATAKTAGYDYAVD